MSTPTNVMWFGNGMAAVFDKGGAQIPEFQGNHEFTFVKLHEAGIDWADITTFGSPKCLFDESFRLKLEAMFGKPEPIPAIDEPHPEPPTIPTTQTRYIIGAFIAAIVFHGLLMVAVNL